MHVFGGNNDAKTEQIIKIIEEMSIEMIMLNKKTANGTLEPLKIEKQASQSQ